MTCYRITQVEIYNVLSWAFIVEQITKADHIRVSRPSQKKQIPRHATAAFTLAKIFFLGLIVLS